MFNVWFCNWYIIKWKFLKQTFCFFFIPKTHIYKKLPFISDHPYRMLIIGGSGSAKTNELLNLIKEQNSDSLTDKIYLYTKDLNAPKYQFLLKKT